MSSAERPVFQGKIQGASEVLSRVTARWALSAGARRAGGE